VTAGPQAIAALPQSPIATLFPGYFALVMATGIVATAASQQELEILAEILFAVSLGAYVVLAILLAMRLVLYPRRLFGDLTSHAKGFAFLTVVAATNVLGSAAALIHGWWGLAWGLWSAGIVLWLLLVYIALVGVVLRNPKPAAGAAVNGTWFLLTVSTESICVLGAILLRRTDSEMLAFVCLATFTLGLMLYLIVMTMVFQRWTLQPLDPLEVDPPAWIAAGAVAITVLAGSNLLLSQGVSPRIARVAPFVEGAVILSWATATFWLPLMIAFGVWRHLVRRIPIRYHPSFWALVFPIGMYGAATFQLRAGIQLDSLSWMPRVVLGVALAAWAVTFAGLILQGQRAIARRIAPRRHAS